MKNIFSGAPLWMRCRSIILPFLHGYHLSQGLGLGDYIVEHYGGKIVCRMMDRTPESFDRIVYKDATWRSWVNQDKCMIGRHRNFDLFKRTDMYVWHGIASSTEKKLAKHINEWKAKGYVFTYKVFPNMGHGTLAGEHPEQFVLEVQAAHRQSLSPGV